MILAILYYLITRDENLLPDTQFNFRNGIALELLLEIAITMSVIVLLMGLN